MNSNLDIRTVSDNVLASLSATNPNEMDAILAKLDGELGAPGRADHGVEMVKRECTLTCFTTCYGITSF